jgi:group II intron reverse transcriptase/maturase
LECAWELVRRNRGAAGIDQTTITDVERHGVDRLLDELATDLRDGTYRPLAARRVFIPKPGSRERRPLSIPAVRDRVVQAAARIVLEPIFEADFLPCSFGFRPRRSAHDALQVLVDEAWRGRQWVVETDIANCFEAIPHDGLMQAVEERIVDRKLLNLVRVMLRAGVMERGSVTSRTAGTPQGGVISPLLANVYLHRLDRQWQAHGAGVLVRYADDRAPRTRKEELSRSRSDGCGAAREMKEPGRSLVRRPFAVALQGEAANHRKVRRLRAGVLSLRRRRAISASGVDHEGERKRTTDEASKAYRRHRNRGRVVAPG